MNSSGRSYSFLNAYVRAAAQEKTQTLTSTTKTKGQPYSFLVVEDDPMILQSITDELEERGYPVRGLDDANEIPSVLNQLKPSVLLIDYYLSAKNGLQIAEELRVKFSSLTPILISAYSHVGKQARKHGIAFLEKPFSVDQVFAVLGQKKSVRSNELRNRNIDPPSLFDDLIKFFRAEPP